VENIGHYAFSSCSNLFSFKIPKSVTTIGQGAFTETGWFNNQPDGILYHDDWLIGYKGEKPTGKIVITEGTRGIADYAFCNCSGMTSITIPNSVKGIGALAFSDCSGLTSVTIPKGVTSIDGWSFYGCSSMTSLSIGSSVKTINDHAFASCKELTDVYCLAEDVPITNIEAFIETPIENATLYVPAASIEAYKASEPWKNFKFIKGITPYNELCDVNGDGTIDVADIASIIDVMAAGDKIVEQVIAADVNQDGVVDVADIATIIDEMAGK